MATLEIPSPEDVAASAVMRFGMQLQVQVAIEEMAELTQALTRLARNRSTRAEVASEIADVMLTMQSLRIIFDAEEVDAELERKTLRLAERVRTADVVARLNTRQRVAL